MSERLRRPIALLQEFSIPLIAGVVLAVLFANVAPEAYAAFVHWSPLGHGSHLNVHFLVNDIFMALFFGIAAKEITESCLPGGALNPPRKAINPLLGTIGGVLGPIGVYFAWVALSGDASIAKGWGIPTATDIALAWLVARQVFGKEHPAVSFLLLLAVADDGIGLGIIAIFYPDPAHPVEPVWLGVVGAAMAGAYALRRGHVQSFWAYLAGPGVLSWAGLYMAHLHPALALVAVVPFMPSMGHDEGLFAEEGNGKAHHDTLNTFEHTFKLPVDLGLFFFGIANAGVAFSGVGAATWGVMLALIVGKTVGIFTFSMTAHAMGYPLPEGMNPRSLAVAGMTAALGLTVALFVAGVAFTDPGLQGAAKMGALGSVLAVPLVIFMAKALKVGRFAPAPAVREPGSREIRIAVPKSGPSTVRPIEI
jgi:NhaA family Na+:H+ antiporter